MKKRIVFITDNGLGGVKDQTKILAKIFKRKNIVKIKIVDQKIQKIKTKDLKKDDTIILQYSGYGLSKRGAPLWFVKELISIKKKVNKIIIIFHELYAVAYYPWKSAFWLHYVQKFIYKTLAKNADLLVTPSKVYFKKIEGLKLNKKILHLPTISNVGELIRPNYKKKNFLVVFGLAREEVYRMLGNNLFLWAKKNYVEIIDIGPKITDPEISNNLSVNESKVLGLLSKEKISNIFKSAKYGLINYDINLIDKSGIFNAYASHGIIPIIINKKKNVQKIIKKNIHYYSALPKKIYKNNFINNNIWNWYQGHNSNIYANKLYDLLLRL